jgi:uncharacterized protein (DUF1330 family)
VTAFVDPTAEQLQALAAGSDEGPIVMLNLLRFKERADGVFADEGISGREAYERYMADAAGHLDRVGGRLLVGVECAETVIGADGEWDVCALVEYPSRAAFLEMIGDESYQQAHPKRSAALADSRLIACSKLDAALS